MPDDILSGFDREQTTQAGAEASLGQAWKLNPDQQARAQAVAQSVGAQPATAHANMDLLSGWDRAQKASAALQTAPATAAWLAHPQEGVNNAAVSHDQVGFLADLEHRLTAAFTPPDLGRLRGQAVSSFYGSLRSMVHGLGTFVDAERLKHRSPAEQQVEDYAGTGPSFSDFVSPASKFFGQIADAAAIKNPNTAEKGVGLVSGAAPSVGAAFINPLLGALTFGAQGADQIEQEANAKGTTIEDPKVQTAVQGNAVLQGALGMLSPEAMAGKFLPKLAKPALETAKKLAVGGTSATALGAAMQTGENVVAKSTFDPERNLGQGVPESAAQMGALGLITHGMLHLAGHVDAAGGDAANAIGSGQAIDSFDKAVDMVRESKVLERSPERFQTLMQDVAPEGRVYVPAETVATYLQKLSPEDQQRFLVRSGAGDQIGPALASHSDVVFPADAYLAHVAPTDAHDAFKDDYRLTLDGMSRKEKAEFDKNFDAYMQQHGQALGDEAQKSAAAGAPGEAVYQDVFKQVREAGYPIDAAQQYAALYAARYEARASRLGTDAWSEYQGAGTGQGVAIKQMFPGLQTFGRTDVLIDALKKRYDPKAKTGPSLLEFMAKNGGLNDEGGELAALDADKWRKPFTPKLVKPEGLTLGDMAQKAHDAGYFPDATERPDSQGLLDAIREELAGKPRYALPADHGAADFPQALDELERLLHDRGLNPGEASPEEIKTALDEHMAQPLESGRNVYDQPADGSGFTGSRGSISLGDGPALIRLFQSRDLSTLLHETGHLWLEEMRADAAREDAPEQVKADWQAIAKHLGIDGDPTVDQHEAFARSIEHYLMEGRAPSEVLRGAFQRFKAWLVTIYRNLTALNVHVSDEMRQVFDRLLATDDEIEAAAKASGFEPADPKLLGMTEAQGKAYHNAVQRARGEASDQVLRKAMADIRRQRTAEWKDERERTRAEVADQIDQRPDVKALHWLTRGELLGVPDSEQPGKVRLDAHAVADIYGSRTVLDMLPRSVPAIYTDEGGIHPDEVAEITGHRSGEAMLNAIMALEQERRTRAAGKDKRSARQFLTDQETDRVMAERHGDALTDGSIEQEALAAIHNERAGAVLSAELKALSRKTKAGEPTSLQILQRWAERYMQDQRFRDLQPQVYMRAGRTAARLFEEALVKGDDAEALVQKERQLLNHVLYREAVKARDASQATVARLGRYASRQTLKSMAQDYLDQIHDLLERFDFATHSRREADRRSSFAQFVADKLSQGETVYAPDDLMGDAFRKSYHDMSVAELQGLGDAVESLAHLGRLKQKLLVAKDQRDFDEVVQEAQDRAAGLKDRAPDTAAVRKGSTVRKIDAALMKAETIADMMDADDPNGVFNKVLIWGGRDAHAAENDLRRDFSDKLVALHEAVPRDVKTSWRRKVEAPELLDPTTGQPIDLTKANVLAMALNTGTESNLEKMLGGWGWEADKLQGVLDRTLTREDWDFVQGVWNTLESFWPKIAANEKAMTGVEPEKVLARKVTTPHGEYDGGYYPVVYDPTRTPELDRARSKDASDLFNDFFTQVATPKGHTQSRTNFKGPVLLSPEAVIFDHINKVSKRIAYGEYVLSAKRFIEDGRIRKLVEQKVGPEYYKELMPWLQRQVGYRLIDPRSLHGAESFLRGARINFTTAASAVRATVLLEHAAAFAQSANVIGAKWTGQGVLRYAATGGPFGSAPKFIYDRSPMMRDRMGEVNRDMRDIFDQMHNNPSLLNKLRAGAHMPVSWINQMVVAMPTWLGGYHKALSEGMGEEEATRYADKAVSTSHSSGAPMDLARVQDGSEFQKLFTMFYGYHNAQYQLQRKAVWAAGHGQWGKAASGAFYSVLLAPLIGAMVTGKHPDDLDPAHWAEMQFDASIRALWEGVPIVRDLANSALNKIEAKPGDYEMSPIGQAVTTSLQAVEDSRRLALGAMGIEAPEPSHRWLQHEIQALGFWTGLPTGQIAASAEYLKEVAQGEQQPENALQAAEGVAFGPPPKH